MSKAIQRWQPPEGTLLQATQVGWFVSQSDHLAAVAKLEAERDDFERKGKELCSAYGNALIKIHDLEKKLERMQAPVSDALREAAITACELCAGGNKFVETIPRLEEQRSKDRCKWFHRYADTGEMASICTAFKIHDLIAARATAPQSKEEPNE